MARKPPAFQDHPVSFADAIEHGLVRGVCLYVSDGDTADFLLDLGWFQYSYTLLRFKGIDAPEIRRGTEKEKAKGQETKRRVTELIFEKSVLIKSYKDKNSFERFIGEVFIQKEKANANFSEMVASYQIHDTSWYSLAELLVKEELAKVADF